MVKPLAYLKMKNGKSNKSQEQAVSEAKEDKQELLKYCLSVRKSIKACDAILENLNILESIFLPKN